MSSCLSRKTDKSHIYKHKKLNYKNHDSRKKRFQIKKNLRTQTQTTTHSGNNNKKKITNSPRTKHQRIKKNRLTLTLCSQLGSKK